MFDGTIFKFYRKKKIDEIIERVNKKGLVKRYILLALGVFLVAFLPLQRELSAKPD